MSDIPQWALDRAWKLTQQTEPALSFCKEPAKAWMFAFARYIAEHEEPPVDPLLIEAREIAISESYGGRARWAEAWREKIMRGDDDQEDRVKIALAALKRGIEIAKAHGEGE